MSNLNLNINKIQSTSNVKISNLEQSDLGFDFEKNNLLLESKNAIERVEWTFDNMLGGYALSSSFGIQSAVSLHMLTQVFPDIPVILIDTSYLFPETYQYIDKLTSRLKLNIKIYRAEFSNAWQEARYGQLWEQGLDGLNQYNRINKVDPMDKALSELGIQTCFAGLMRHQSESRSNLQTLQKIRGRIKVHPLIDWDKKMVYEYLKKNKLPYHPLWEKGYASIGDIHSSLPLKDGMREEDTRFGGLKRECGLHEDKLSGL